MAWDGIQLTQSTKPNFHLSQAFTSYHTCKFWESTSVNLLSTSTETSKQHLSSVQIFLVTRISNFQPWVVIIPNILGSRTLSSTRARGFALLSAACHFHSLVGSVGSAGAGGAGGAGSGTRSTRGGGTGSAGSEGGGAWLGTAWPLATFPSYGHKPSETMGAVFFLKVMMNWGLDGSG